MNLISHYISGAEQKPSSTRTAAVYDPALVTESGRVALADAKDIKAAIDSAKLAYPAWRDSSLAKRQQIIFKFRELLNERKPELAAIITAEHGKVLSDALGEITRGQEVVELPAVCLICSKVNTRKTRQPTLMFTPPSNPLESWASLAPLISQQWYRCGFSP